MSLYSNSGFTDWAPRPQHTIPSWQKELPVEKRDEQDADFVIRTTGKRSETILDLTGKSAKTPYSLHPESDRDIARRKLEKTKRALSNGNREGLDKDGAAAAMKGVKRKLNQLYPR